MIRQRRPLAPSEPCRRNIAGRLEPVQQPDDNARAHPELLGDFSMSMAWPNRLDAVQAQIVRSRNRQAWLVLFSSPRFSGQPNRPRVIGK